jgi:hypothetical protein
MSDVNKTKLRLEIDKTIQPKQFEPIKIMVDIEETIVWNDKKERDQKVREYTSKISGDFVNIFNHVLKRIGEEDRCIGQVVTSDTSLTGKADVVDDDDEFLFD